ncbi:hypothetical protein [Companilactobacillus nantensis]|uniref:Uncharacterized protein n=1 Tax=Companilactobacillus nantensis DSM 16982 TaxID=1423774 RepID=A0A0R1WRI6_9LACO|nr:hypothetical protein [Companilactobacillus nantensis]KRM18475.1 hypothetical protein FD31_GL001023 [Companilactobacillus nantensis DSM 16982]GEO63047.1 hypothetical protein LNA01_02300 [Companilactobacillus nantensis]
MVDNVKDSTARKLLAKLPDGIQIVDKNQKILHTAIVNKKTNKISLPSDWLGTGTNANTGGNTGTDTENPSAGVDYYAGSIANGEITERYLLYQRDETVDEEPAVTKTVTFLRDVGSRMNMVGDGLTFLIHLRKTKFDNGVKGEVTDIYLNYDPENIVKTGNYTTTSPHPAYVKTADFGVGKQISVPINGIGENLSGKNVKAPKLLLTFNADKTMSIESATGYDNDGDSTGATGANYDVVVDMIATYSVQTAMSQMPETVNFFTGSASGDIALSGTTDFLENTSDGIEITFDNYFFVNTNNNVRTNSNAVFNSLKIRIPKEKFVNGYKFNLSSFLQPKGTRMTEDIKSNTGMWTSNPNAYDYFYLLNNPYIEIKSAAIDLPSQITYSSTITSGPITNNYFVPTISKVTPYKN